MLSTISNDSIHGMIHVVTDVLFPVAFSMLVVVILVVCTNVVHEMRFVVSVPVKIIDPQLHAGSDPIVIFAAFKVTCPFIILVIFTLSAVLPPLFP